jgi:hypothetical protein
VVDSSETLADCVGVATLERAHKLENTGIGEFAVDGTLGVLEVGRSEGFGGFGTTELALLGSIYQLLFFLGRHEGVNVTLKTILLLRLVSLGRLIVTCKICLGFVLIYPRSIKVSLRLVIPRLIIESIVCLPFDLVELFIKGSIASISFVAVIIESMFVVFKRSIVVFMLVSFISATFERIIFTRQASVVCLFLLVLIDCWFEVLDGVDEEFI